MLLAELAVEHRVAKLSRASIHYVVRGTGPLVVLLHGFPETWWSWRYQIGPLAEAGFCVVAPDLRGYGESDKQGPYDLASLAADVVDLIHHLGETRALLVGHDWGGAVAWYLGAFRPELCERIAVLCCPHPTQMRRALRTSATQLRKSWYGLAFCVPWLPERALSARSGALGHKIFLSAAVDKSHYSAEELAPILRALQGRGAAKAMLGYYRTAVRQALFQRRALDFPPVAVETLLVWSMQDIALDYDALVPGTERLAPNLRVERLEGVGHFVQSERPELVNGLLLDYLRDKRSAPAPSRETV